MPEEKIEEKIKKFLDGLEKDTSEEEKKTLKRVKEFLAGKEKVETDLPYPSGDFSVDENLAINQVAVSLGLNRDDLESSDVQKKLEYIFQYYKRQNLKKSFFDFVRELKSKIGTQHGIDPLDGIYAELVTRTLKHG